MEQALDLDGGERLLDVPCGHGRVANRLAERGYRTTGVDRSTSFLDRARADAADRGVDVGVNRLWEALTPGRRRGILYQIGTAKSQATRDRRIANLLREIGDPS